MSKAFKDTDITFKLLSVYFLFLSKLIAITLSAPIFLKIDIGVFTLTPPSTNILPFSILGSKTPGKLELALTIADNFPLYTYVGLSSKTLLFSLSSFSYIFLIVKYK